MAINNFKIKILHQSGSHEISRFLVKTQNYYVRLLFFVVINKCVMYIRTSIETETAAPPPK